MKAKKLKILSYEHTQIAINGGKQFLKTRCKANDQQHLTLIQFCQLILIIIIKLIYDQSEKAKRY